MTEPTTAATAGRGRPRPQDTIERDNKVHALLVEQGSLSRTQIAEKLGITTSLAYMSLFRLNKDGRVRRVTAEGSDAKSHMWEAV